MREFIDEVVTYIKEYIGENVDFSPIDASLRTRLPMSISEEFELYQGRILNRNVVLTCTDKANTNSPKQMQKKIHLIEQKLDTLVILATKEMASYNTLRLANLRVNFIIPNKQLFLPALLMNFRKEQNIGTDLTESISPIAQVVLLYHLQIESIQGMATRTLVEKLDVSYASANRAIRWLCEKGLIRVSDGKTKLIEIQYSKKLLWEKALPFLESPIKQILYTDEVLSSLKSGINALSQYTMINEEVRECYAMTKTELNNLSIPINEKFGTNLVEIWKYSPRLLSRTRIVDKLSLYLTLRDSEDERIQIELDNLLNTLWLED